MEKKDNRGGARRKVDPKKGKASGYNVSLYPKEAAYLKKEYGSITKAVKSLLPVK